jgi:heterodisulfide reductase subunit A-like polyferredoxin
MSNKTCILYCNCGAGIISDKKQELLTESIKKLNITIFELHDLCSLSVNEHEFLNLLENDYDKILIVACYPRAIENMLNQNKIELSNYEVLNFREKSVDDIAESLQEKTNDDTGDSNYQIKKSSLTVPAWYPVIDESKCTLCGQCARFCLFGVYQYNKKSLNVVNPLACKNNCPACGRTCPASAIIFPRLPENSVLSGAEPNEEATKKPEGNGGLFVLLNERNNSRKNIFRQGLIKQAENERDKALAELKRGLKKTK